MYDIISLKFSEVIMSILELLGIVFLIIVILNLLIGVWAIKTAFFGDKDVEAYSRN